MPGLYFLRARPGVLRTAAPRTGWMMGGHLLSLCWLKEGRRACEGRRECTCGAVLCSRKRVFGLRPRVWHRAPKTPGLFPVSRVTKVSFVMRWLLECPKSSKDGVSQSDVGVGRSLEVGFTHLWQMTSSVT